MEKNDFKAYILKVFYSLTFKKSKKIYIRDFGDYILRFDVQKSNYSNGYYFNYMIIVKELHQQVNVDDEKFGDLEARLVFKIGERNTDILDIGNMSGDEFEKEFERELTIIVSTIEKHGIRGYLVMLPQSLVRAPQYAKEYFVRLLQEK